MRVSLSNYFPLYYSLQRFFFYNGICIVNASELKRFSIFGTIFTFVKNKAILM